VESVLSSDDLAFWDEHGYVVVREAVSAASAAWAAAAVYEFICARADDPESWYGESALKQGIWVPLMRHPALLNNRNSERIYAAFAQLWGRSDLWMNTDQCGFNPPEGPNYRFSGQGLHWDVSLTPPIPFGTQALLYLTDTAAAQGAFQCVPGYHRRIDRWLHSLPQDANPRTIELSRDAIPIPGRAGDLVIWHHALPHAASRNRGDQPRLVQYMNMRPSSWAYANAWK
jgi:ectoine hydroxylase-related dioxygenase (phytanoyl-CoA dioxygenase family)